MRFSQPAFWDCLRPELEFQALAEPFDLGIMAVPGGQTALAGGLSSTFSGFYITFYITISGFHITFSGFYITLYITFKQEKS